MTLYLIQNFKAVGSSFVGAKHRLLVPLLHFPSYEPVRTFSSDTTCYGCWKNSRSITGNISQKREMCETYIRESYHL